MKLRHLGRLLKMAAPIASAALRLLGKPKAADALDRIDAAID